GRRFGRLYQRVFKSCRKRRACVAAAVVCPYLAHKRFTALRGCAIPHCGAAFQKLETGAKKGIPFRDALLL
ncbi:MAG: hypothetical protein RSE54_04315, partial [Ruthenibacterium sp.]